MSYTAIDSALYGVYHLTFRYADRRPAELAYEDLAWFVYTDRASMDFVRALCSLKGNQRAALLRRMVAAGGSTDSHIKAAREYLKA